MVTQSPFPSSRPSPFAFAEQIFEQFAARIAPRAWAIHEVQHRLVLLLNHVLQREPEAMVRLQRQQGKSLCVRWRELSLSLIVTPAGLLELLDAPSLTQGMGESRTQSHVQHDLNLHLLEHSPLGFAQKLAAGAMPEVRIEGDVQFAAEVNWLVDNLRWDVEEDLSRILGDVAAHRVCELARTVASAVHRFVQGAPRGTAP
jgi:ubiquinone biosynthesis accessory factor UbiJ